MSEEDEYGPGEDNFNYKSITCESIPEIFLDKLVAKKHFSRFGKIKRFILRPKRLSCTVEYESENDAEEAVVNAGLFNGHQFTVKYTQNEVAHARNTEEWVDPDVQAELDSMRSHMRSGTAPALNKPTSLAKNLKPIVKARQAGTETIAKIVDSGLKGELEAILRRQAGDNEDKYRILDARDKLIRATTVRTTDIKRAESIKGFCPDMCPEKERLMRENRNQIGIYEQDEGNRTRMIHKHAVKEYSRSSADQETPLPHELRSESVLKFTMTYLMHRVMDLCESDDVNLADWYHFIWDRTRSIRKDTTQQELCSPTAVGLVEQCARFHIHCAARLVAEDASVFDQKINTENLTKCLQTLKYMYHDLRLQNKKCPNEAEFRAYVILLNLNDSNFLWEVKQLPEEIQNSGPVRFAISTYLAMESNNYVRFFKLVREATYMTACILLRYFIQVRIQGIRAIMIAYKSPLQVVAIPITYLYTILGFESVEATRQFFEAHGLDCEGNKVNLDKKAFYMPEMPFQLDRALKLVEAKRQCSVGEAVCGQPLDSFELFERYVPHSSFDENGYLKSEAWNALDQLRGADAKKKTVKEADGLFKVPTASPPISPRFKSPSPVLKNSPEPTKMQTFQPIVKPVAQPIAPTGNIFGSFTRSDNQPPVFSLPALEKPVQEVQPKPLGKSIFGGTTKNSSAFSSGEQSAAPPIFGLKSSAFEKPQEAQSTSIFSKTPTLMSKDSVFQHFKTEPPNLSIFNRSSDSRTYPKDHSVDENDRLQRESEEKRKQQAEEKEREQLHKQKELIRKEEERRIGEERARHQQKVGEIERKSNALLDDIINEEIWYHMDEIVVEELRKFEEIVVSSERACNYLIDEVINELIEQLAGEEIAVVTKNQDLLSKYFTRWFSNVRRALEHRKLMEVTPIWISDRSVADAHPQQAQTLELMDRYRQGVSGQFLLRSPNEKPIDIFSIFLRHCITAKPLFNSHGLIKHRKYLKFVISLPTENEELRGLNSFMNNWLAKRIKRQTNDSTDEFFCESQDGTSICLRKVEGIVPTNESRRKVTEECDHADGLVFIMSSTNFLNSRKRLHHLLKLSKIFQKIPVAIIVYNSTTDEESIEEQLELQKLIDDEKISYYSLFPCTIFKCSNNLRLAVKETFKFLAQYSEQDRSLEMQNLCSFLRTALGDEFWKRLADSARINPSFRKMCTKPATLASLFNDAIDLITQLLQEDFENSPEFPRELQKFVPKQLLDIPVDIEHFPGNWKNSSRNRKIQNFLKEIKLPPFPQISHDLVAAEQQLLEYAGKCIASETHAKRAGYGAIKRLLESMNAIEFRNFTQSERFEAISWLPIVESISLELLTFRWHLVCSNLPHEVIYNKMAFREYTSVPWWFDNVTLRSIKMEKTPECEIEEDYMTPPPAKKSKTDIASFDVDALLERSTALIEKADRNIAIYKTITSKSREIARTLDENLYKQELFNRRMKRLLGNDI